MPIPESSRICQPKASSSSSRKRRASGVMASTSRPAYMSSVFSRKITMSTSSGCLTGDGTPWNHRTGRRHT